MATEVDEVIKRISTRKGVEGIVVVNAEGIPIRTTLDEEQSTVYAGICATLAMKARMLVTSVDSSDELRMIRFRSKKHELLIAPDRSYLMIVIQNPSVE